MVQFSILLASSFLALHIPGAGSTQDESEPTGANVYQQAPASEVPS